MAKTAIPKVALLIETARGFGRGLLRGIVRYARVHGPWSFYLTPGDFAQALPKMRQWGGAGIIARITTPAMEQAILESGLPTIAVDLSERQLQPDHPLSRLSEVASDSFGAARMAAEHLLERDFRHYAFVGIPGQVWSERRGLGFCERIAAAGFEPCVYPRPRRKADHAWEREQAILAEWLKGLPKPLGLMACNDDRGREVLVAARAAGIRVPEEIAVVGVDNDELLCELADPPLSSVAINAERGGYAAAALLDRMMRRRTTKPRRLLVEPLHVVARRSTDIVALGDAEVARALRFIHDNAARPIAVDDVVQQTGVSRRTLEMRFQNSLKRSVRQEIHRVRMERAKRLLLETDLSAARVATAAGFNTLSYFGQVFRQDCGTSPAEYRRIHHDE